MTTTTASLSRSPVHSRLRARRVLAGLSVCGLAALAWAAFVHPLPPGAAEAFVNRAMSPERDEDVWAIDGSANRLAELLGVVSLTRMEAGQSELGFWIGAGFWNTGFATEAVAALVAANPHNSRTLFAEAFQDNPGSARVLTNSGFEYLGDAESWSVARNARVPTWTYLRKIG